MGPRKPRFGFVAPKHFPADFVQPVTCTSCGCVLSIIERTMGNPAICRFPLCQHKRAVAAAQELQQKTLEEISQRGAEELDRVEQKLAELGIDPASYDIAVFPAFERHLTDMTHERKAALADRLSDIAAEMAIQPIEEVTTSFNLAGKPINMAHIAQACTTCRGDCCKNGAEHAYLNRQTFTRALAASPEMTREDLILAYMRHVPDKSYEGSCIYHGEKGCALPSEKRSDTCNDFFCNGTRSLATTVRGNNSAEVVAAAMKGDKVVRLAVINGKEMKYLLGE
jgi:hypothetical protein